MSRSGEPLCPDEVALDAAAALIRRGEILALKGLGGFQLVVDATNAESVRALRRRKRREAKPFAVMFPSIEVLEACCRLEPEAERVLRSAESPILLLPRRSPQSTDCRIADDVAPLNPRLGVMLPYTPLHLLLMQKLGTPIVCTSGNHSDEPICIGNSEAFERLGDIADAFLVHDRDIVRPIDDSVARLGPDGLELLRRARGYAPLPITLSRHMRPVLAMGGRQKCTVCIAVGDKAVMSQHLGDLGSAEAALLLERTVRDLTEFFGVIPEVVACDRHPDYESTRLAERLARGWNARLVRVQHHHAHVGACLAERGLEGDVLGLAWDGAGWGEDGTIWGGEALVCRDAGYERIAHLRSFPLLGGDAAAREPRRSALGLLHAAGKSLGPAGFRPDTERAALEAVLARGTATVPTTSVGRLFDAVAALCGIRGESRFEGEAAMELEFACGSVPDPLPYRVPLVGSDRGLVGDFGPLVDSLLADLSRATPVEVISARFHTGLAEFAAACARTARKQQVVLTGGCFQNTILSRETRRCLLRDGFEPIVPRKTPCNDGGLSLGQLFVAGLALGAQP